MVMNKPDANDLLFGASVPVISFEVNTHVEGVLIAYDTNVQRSFRPDGKIGEIEKWEDGSLKYQVILTLQTEERDPEDPADDGRRRVFLKGRSKESPESSLNAIQDAVKASGKRRIDLGAWVELDCYKETPSKVKNGFPTKYYRGEYVPPGAPSASDAEE